jgi:hypothetical protein
VHTYGALYARHLWHHKISGKLLESRACVHSCWYYTAASAQATAEAVSVICNTMSPLPDPVLHVTDTFESGNIQVLDASDPSNIQLAIKPDVFCQTDGRAHYQWFYFAVTGAAQQQNSSWHDKQLHCLDHMR